MKLFTDLLAMPLTLSRASRYTIANGVIYMAAGADPYLASPLGF